VNPYIEVKKSRKNRKKCISFLGIVASKIYKEINKRNIPRIKKMKSRHIINEDINEAPVGLINKAGLALGTMIPGRTGQKMRGALDTARVANEWAKQFQTWLGRQGIKTPTTQDLSKFVKDELGINKTESRSLANEASLTAAQVDAYFKKLAQRAARGGSGGTTSTSTPPSTSSTGVGSGTRTPLRRPKQPGLVQRAVSGIKSMVGKSQQPSTATPNSTTASTTTPVAKSDTLQGGYADSYIQNWAKAVNAAKSRSEKIDLAKEVVNYMIDRYSPQLIRGDVPKFAKPEIKANAEKVKRLQTQVASTLKRAKLDDPRIMKSLSTGVKLERRDYGIARKMLESLGLTWRDLDMKIVLSESATDYVVLKSI
jgi:hypothetical protein